MGNMMKYIYIFSAGALLWGFMTGCRDLKVSEADKDLIKAGVILESKKFERKLYGDGVCFAGEFREQDRNWEILNSRVIEALRKNGVSERLIYDGITNCEVVVAIGEVSKISDNVVLVETRKYFGEGSSSRTVWEVQRNESSWNVLGIDLIEVD